MKKQFATEYNPLYFLSSLGNGGLAVSFFIYLMFMVKHPDAPMATFGHVYPLLTGSNTRIAFLVGAAMAAILYFTFRHFWLLARNLSAFSEYKKSEEYQKLITSNSEVSLMAIPLTLAMSVNVSFIIGAVFVPGLWNIVETLFPFSIIAFTAVGILALKYFAHYAARVITKGDFDFIQNNHLGQMISSMAFIMVSVGLAAPAAMTKSPELSALAIVLSIFFGSISLLLMMVKMVLGFKSILRQGLAKESAPSIWSAIPILTLIGITGVRLTSAAFHNFLHTNPPALLMFFGLAFIISLQIITGFIGYIVLKRVGYFEEFVSGPKKSAGSFALICPGVAFFVLGMFFISWGLVKTNILTMFSPAYFLILAPLVFVQFKTIHVLGKLNKKLLTASTTEDDFSIIENINQGPLTTTT